MNVPRGRHEDKYQRTSRRFLNNSYHPDAPHIAGSPGLLMRDHLKHCPSLLILHWVCLCLCFENTSLTSGLMNSMVPTKPNLNLNGKNEILKVWCKWKITGPTKPNMSLDWNSASWSWRNWFCTLILCLAEPLSRGQSLPTSRAKCFPLPKIAFIVLIQHKSVVVDGNLGEHDVVGFDVKVNDVSGVQVVQSLHHLDQHRD